MILKDDYFGSALHHKIAHDAPNAHTYSKNNGINDIKAQPEEGLRNPWPPGADN